MKNDEQDDLWHLLGRAKKPTISPFFSRDVLRQIRTQEEVQPGVLDWLRQSWKLAVIGGFSFLILIAGVLYRSGQQSEAVAILASQVSASPDYQVISHLDELLASEENSVWLEPAVY